MISFQDRTFCSLSRTCKWSDKCSRVLTPELREQAIKLDLPVSYSTFPCYTAKESKDNVV